MREDQVYFEVSHKCTTEVFYEWWKDYFYVLVPLWAALGMSSDEGNLGYAQCPHCERWVKLTTENISQEPPFYSIDAGKWTAA